MAKHERRFAIDGWQTGDFQLRAEGDGMTFAGYAAVFNTDSDGAIPGFGVERIAPGAFAKSLSEARNVKMFLNHNSDLVLGSTKGGTLRLAEDEVGLRVEADLPDTQTGRDLSQLVKRGDVDAMSFGFTPIKHEQRKDGTDGVVHTEVRLWEVSPVTSWPAYAATSAFVRHLAELAEVDPEPLADALRILAAADSDERLSDDQRGLLITAINARSDAPVVAAELVAITSRSTARVSEMEAMARKLGLA